MIERILSLMRTKQLTTSQFADEIGVLRSSMSHLVSGRNKPSLEFVQRILSKYPGINPEWLLSGKGEMNRDGSQVPAGEREEIPVPEKEPVEIKEIVPKKVSQDGSRHRKRKEPDLPQKKLEKIVFFFGDNTFREFFPED